MSVGDGVDPVVIGSRDGSVLVRGGGYVDLATGAGAIVAPGDFAELQSTADALGALFLEDGLPRVLRLLPGVYEVPRFDIPSGVYVEGAGETRTEIRGTLSPAAGLADDPTNYLVSLSGALDLATLNTTSTAQVAPGQYAIPVASVGALQPGGSFIITGHNPVGQQGNGFSEGIDVILYEMFRASDTWNGASPITLDRMLQQTHAAAMAVQAVIPCELAGIAGCNLVCDGGSYAVGVLATYARDVLVGRPGARVRAGGFSRAICNFRQGVNTSTFDLYRRSEVNAIIFRESTFDTRGRISCAPDGLRTHPLGTPRAGDTNICRSVGDEVRGDVRRMCIGTRQGGGVACLRELQVDDCDPTEAIARDAGQWIAGGICGAAVDDGSSTLPPAEFGFGNRLSVQATGCRVPTLSGPATFLLHDNFFLAVDRLQAINKGLDGLAGGAAGFSCGLRLGDVGGSIGSYESVGNNYAIMTRGTVAVHFGRVRVDGVAGSGGQQVVALLYEHGAGQGTSPIIDDLLITNISNGHFRFGGDFLLVPDWTCGVKKYCDDSPLRVWREAVVAFQPDGVKNFLQGEICALDPASPVGTRQIIDPGAGTVSFYSVLTGGTHDFGFGYMFVAPVVGSTVLCDAAAVILGDKLEWSAARVAHANNASARAFGVALSDKAGGAAGLVRVGALI